MNIINTIGQIPNVYTDGSFDMEKWKNYIRSISPALEQMCFNDMEQTIDTGLYSFEKDFLPILNSVICDESKLIKLNKNFNVVTANLDEKVKNAFGRSIDVEIVIYLGLCNGAGWVETIGNKTYCLLGVEKILELNWYDLNSLYGLIYHELGHVYQNQYGVLERKFDDRRSQFLWQLFTEGIAMHFEQALVGDFDYYHQDKNGWKDWCDGHLEEIKKDFYHDLDTMTFDNQIYFGDWVEYHNQSDIGYYLGGKFVQYICRIHEFDSILSFNISEVERLYLNFMS